MQLKDKVAVITGGTRGIGRAITERFVSEGARVVMAGRNRETGAQLVEELAVGDRLKFQATDICQQVQAESLIDDTVNQYGGIDILVNNAGGEARFIPMNTLSDERWREIMDLNLNSVFWTCRRALSYMLPKGHGRIINISSVFGKIGCPGQSAYSAAKHGVNGLTKTLAQEVGQQGVNVNAICPGLFDTELASDMAGVMAEGMGLTKKEVLQSVLNQTALKRPLQPRELAGMAVLLAGPDGDGITGMQLSVDGGWATY